MRVTKVSDLPSDRVVKCPNGGFVSRRLSLAEDGAGFTVTNTLVPKGGPQRWAYKNHAESCYCISGRGKVTLEATGESWEITPGTMYSPGSDPHLFQAIEDTELLCVFRPALTGDEVHEGENGTYESRLSPVYGVRAVPIDRVVANTYNPNRVAPPEMELLETSIREDGYTQPIVTFYDDEKDQYEVVDGFHRYLILRDVEDIREREGGMLPVVVIDKQMGERMASTIRHNRARGTHNVELMSTIVAELVEMGKGDRWICKHIGMSADELLRMKQVTGLSALFQNRDFSESWDAEIVSGDEVAMMDNVKPDIEGEGDHAHS